MNSANIGPYDLSLPGFGQGQKGTDRDAMKRGSDPARNPRITTNISRQGQIGTVVPSWHSSLIGNRGNGAGRPPYSRRNQKYLSLDPGRPIGGTS